MRTSYTVEAIGKIKLVLGVGTLADFVGDVNLRSKAGEFIENCKHFDVV